MEGGEQEKGSFIMFDFEARGPSMRLHGVNGVGLVAFDRNGAEVGAYASGIAATEGQTFEEDTKKFWDRNPEALAWTEKHAKPAEQVANEIVAFHADIQARFGEVVWIGWPAAYDWSRLVAFLDAHLPGGTPAALGFKAVCVSSMADALKICAGLDEKPSLESLGFENTDKHNPESDARVQGFAFFEVVRRLGAVRDQSSQKN
jgi:hypothetical protein